VWHQPLPDGNRFVVELPVGAAAPVPARGLSVPREPASPPGAGPVEPRPITVLVCDDEQPIRSLLVRVLDKAGIRTLAAGSGMEALDLLEAAHVDAVVTDHFMAGMTGTELCERAVAMRPSLAGHVAVMSGDAGNAELVAFARASGVTILAKPFDNARLPGLIRTLADT
jgi:CheY-like chemotaxis protein